MTDNAPVDEPTTRLASVERELEQLREERKRLLDEQERWKMLVDLGSDWLWEIDASGRYTFVGPQIRRFLGYAPEEALGKTPFDFMAPAEAARVAAQFEPIANARLPFKALENVNTHKDGSLVTLETSGFPLFDSKGEYVGYRGMDRDVTASRRADAEHARLKDEIIRTQAAALVELSTPLIPLGERILVMPLVGTVDARRAEQIMETLLTGVGSGHTAVAIIDITGVNNVDTNVASALVSAAKAVRLLGAQVVLTGIRPEVARVLVNLGVDLGAISTQRTLQDGIAFASRFV